jgi:sugar phosphate permease
MVQDHVDRMFPRRWELIFLIGLGYAVQYMYRLSLGVAIGNMQDSLAWSNAEAGLMLSSFYIGNALGQLPVAFSIQYFGAKLLFGLSVILPAMIALVFPALVKLSYTLGLLVRIIDGFFASPLFPASYFLYKSWVPKGERTLMLSSVMCGSYMVHPNLICSDTNDPSSSILVHRVKCFVLRLLVIF